MVSEPLAMPDVLKPKTQTVWEVFTIDVGVAATIVATPPEIESAKSPTSRSPVAPVALYTFSAKVTVTSEFALLTVVPEIIGSTFSLSAAVLLDWEVAAALAAAS